MFCHDYKQSMFFVSPKTTLNYPQCRVVVRFFPILWICVAHELKNSTVFFSASLFFSLFVCFCKVVFVRIFCREHNFWIPISIDLFFFFILNLFVDLVQKIRFDYVVSYKTFLYDGISKFIHDFHSPKFVTLNMFPYFSYEK